MSSHASTPAHVNLGIGEIVVSAEPIVVSTVLGSCIAVCIFSVNGNIGGINHFALPLDPLSKASQDDPYRYGDTSTTLLLDTILATPGVRKQDLRAKLIGGANMKGQGVISADVGIQNLSIAKKILDTFGITLLASDVGGPLGRKLFFYTQSGRLMVSEVNGTTKASAKKPMAAPDLAMTVTPSIKPALVPAPTFRPAENRPKRVLIVDDSKTMQEVLKRIFGADPGLEVAGVAASAREAKAFLSSHAVDVMTLDIHMPEMDGVTYLAELMKSKPMPVVMLTAMGIEDGDAVLRALELGAVDYIQKPKMAELAQLGASMCEKLRVAASASLRKTKSYQSRQMGQAKAEKKATRMPFVAIGSSTGGTEAIKEVLLQMGSDIPPIVIVQHIPPVFSKNYAVRLNSLCPFEVKEAEDGDKLLSGRVLIAPGGMQMSVESDGYGFKVKVVDGPLVNRHKPSVDVLFDSVAHLAKGNAIGVILTGMGADGAKGMLAMKNSGCPTIAQDEKSCVVFGMPKEAIKAGGVDSICDLNDIARKLQSLLQAKKSA